MFSKLCHFLGLDISPITMTDVNPDYDASSYTLNGLKRLKNKRKFESLDFRSADMSVVDSLFRVEKDEEHSNHLRRINGFCRPHSKANAWGNKVYFGKELMVPLSHEIVK